SHPPANAPSPSPRITRTRIAGSDARSPKTAGNAFHISRVIALRFAGRLSTSVATLPRAATWSSSIGRCAFARGDTRSFPRSGRTRQGTLQPIWHAAKEERVHDDRDQ